LINNAIVLYYQLTVQPVKAIMNQSPVPEVQVRSAPCGTIAEQEAELNQQYEQYQLKSA
jgi:hypothetical protein